MMRWALLSIVVALWTVQPLIGALAWAESHVGVDRSSPGPPPSVIAGPLFITTIYPIIKLDRTLVEVMPITENAYNFWGKEYISQQRIKTYFPTPLAYPYRFSQMGLELLRNHLKEITLVDPTSVEMKSWPTITQKWQGEYRPDDLQTLLIEEPYVQFRVRGWDRVTFMKFPTFVAAVFDYTRQPVQSYADYKALAIHWRGKIESLRQLEDLGGVLGISASNPILTLVSSPAFMWHNAFGQRYIFSPEPWEEKSRLFLREISLRGASTTINNGEIDGSLVGCNDILHEKDRISVWRFYYSSEPFFYTGQNWPLIVAGPSGPEAMFHRLLRIALFVNITLPDMLDRAQVIDYELKKKIAKVQEMRTELFKAFSLRQINGLHASFNTEQSQLSVINEKIDRIERALNGIRQLRDYVQRSFISPLDVDLVKRSEPKEPEARDHCLEMFHFERRRNVLSDARKAITYEVEINTYLSSAKRNAAEISEQVKSGVDLLENRRNTVDNQKAVALSILFPTGGAIIITCLKSIILLLFFKRRNRRNSILLRTLHRGAYGKWQTTYDTKKFKSTTAWEWLKNLYRHIVAESRDTLTPILGALIGGFIWLALVYL